MVTTRISRWWNSLGVVQIIADDGRLSIVANGVMSLDQMIDRITPENVHGEQFAEIAGAETW